MSEYHLDDDPLGRKLLTKGTALKVFNGPFGTAIIIGFNRYGDAQMARPYAYAAAINVPLLGVEVYTLTKKDLDEYLEQPVNILGDSFKAWATVSKPA